MAIIAKNACHLMLPKEFKYSSAKFYETGVNDPIAIGFGFITHWMD